MLSCGVSDNPSPLPGSGRGSVALFITDNLSVYKQVVSTITGVRLVNSGTGSICTVLHNPVTLDISNLTGKAQYTNLAECPQGNYNRIDVDFSQTVHLKEVLDALNGAPVLTIGDTDGYAKRGVMINMFLENKRVRFEINAKAAHSSQLRISTKLLKLASKVHGAVPGGE